MAIITRAAKLGPLNTAELDNNFIELQRAGKLAFPYKGVDDPIVIVLSGQSNAFGADTKGLYSSTGASDIIWGATDQVQLWRSAGNGTDYDFYDADGDLDALGDTNPNTQTWTEQTHQGSTGKPYVGYQEGGRGHIGVGLARMLHFLTGRKVYMICASFSGRPISQWADGESADVALDAAMTSAMAKPELANVNGADIFGWSQGESDWATGGIYQKTDGELYQDHVAYADAFEEMFNRYRGEWLGEECQVFIRW